MKLKFLISVAAVLAGSAVIAQTVDGIDLGSIRQRVESMKGEAQDTVDGSMGRGSEFEKEVAELEKAAMSRVEDLKGADLGVSHGPVDFDELVGGASDNIKGGRGGDAPLFMVFASLSMPEASLKKLISDTARAGGVVVFRGFPQNSAKAFTDGVLKVVQKDDDYSSIGIDPRLFRAFDVQVVPTFVVASSEFDPCDGFNCRTDVPPHDKMVGNVTVEYALSSFADGRGAGGAVAQVALRNLKDSKK